MRILVLVAAFVAFSALVPAAAAQDEEPSFQDLQEGVQDVGDIEIRVGSKSLEVSWQGITIGPEVAYFLREKVDGFSGDEPDGEVSQDEADAAELLIKSFVGDEFNQYSDDERLSGYLVIDHANPGGAKVTSLVADGLVGPVQSEDAVTISFVTLIGFETRDADVHTVKLDMGRYFFKAVNESKAAELVGDFTLTVGSAEGWTIDPASVQPGCVADALDADSGKMVFTVEDVNCFTERSGVLLSFSITGGDPGAYNVPGFEAPLFALALAGVGLLLRRRA